MSFPGTGRWPNWTGYVRRMGRKVHLAVDTLGDLLAIHVTPATARDRD